MAPAASTEHQAKALPQAGEAATLAKRYALALVALAEEQHALPAVQEQVGFLQQTLAEVPELRQILADPRLSRQQLQQALTAVTRQGQWGEIVTHFLGVIAHNHRAALLPQILAAFAAECARRAGEILVDVRVAQALSVPQQQAITRHLAQATGGTIKLRVTEDASLIGGLILHFNSLQIDASLQGRLASLTRQLRKAA